MPHYKAGTIRLLAQSTKVRSASLREVPTFEEAGVSGIVLDVWQGVFAPPRTPSNIVQLLNAEMGKALADSMVRAKLLEVAQDVVGGSAEQFGRVVQDDMEKYRRLARELKIKIE